MELLLGYSQKYRLQFRSGLASTVCVWVRAEDDRPW